MTASFHVRLDGIPRELAASGAERTEELLREFQLMGRRSGPATLPNRVTALYGALREAGDGREAVVSAGVEELRAGDDTVLAVELDLPLGSERDAVTLALLLDESDDYCQRGAVLTLPRSDALVGLRWWQATEIVRQRHGLPPTPFRPAAAG